MALTAAERKELVLSIEENQILDELMSHPGMKIFLNQAQEQIDAHNNLDGVKNLEDLHYKRGQMYILKWFLSWPQLVRSTLTSLVEQAESEARLHTK